MRPNSMGRSASIALTGATSEHGVDRPDMSEPCLAVLPLPQRYRRRRTADGNIVIEGDSWWEVVGTVLALAATVDPAAAEFGIKFPWEEHYRWWDGTTTAEDLLAGPAAAALITPWLEQIFPDATGSFELIDNRALARES
ncbi:hypothetical protein TSHO111613_16835 [Tsukamurella hominis]